MLHQLQFGSTSSFWRLVPLRRGSLIVRANELDISPLPPRESSLLGADQRAQNCRAHRQIGHLRALPISRMTLVRHPLQKLCGPEAQVKRGRFAAGSLQDALVARRGAVAGGRTLWQQGVLIGSAIDSQQMGQLVLLMLLEETAASTAGRVAGTTCCCLFPPCSSESSRHSCVTVSTMCGSLQDNAT